MKFRHLPVTSAEDSTQNFEQLQAAIAAKWTAPVLEHSWVNFGEVFETTGYMKDALGFVHLRGVVKSGESAKSAFTLPVGFRPGATGQFTSQDGAGAAGRVNVEASGAVVPVGNNAAMRLSGITFLAEG